MKQQMSIANISGRNGTKVCILEIRKSKCLIMKDRTYLCNVFAGVNYRVMSDIEFIEFTF